MASAMETRLFIDGKYVEAKTPARISCYNPTNNSLITSDVHVATEEDVENAVAAAKKAFPLWSAQGPAERAATMVKLADLLDKNLDEIAQLEIRSSGKPTFMAKIEIEAAAKCLRYYAGWCDKIAGESAPATGGFLRIVTYEPLGVCAAVCPFNVPIVMAINKIGPALVTGNTVIVKPSEKTPLGSLVLGRLAASNLKRVALELGGKSAAVVFADANLEVASQWCARGITSMTGQVCMATSRVYVHKDIKERFLVAFRSALQGVEAATGDPSLESTMMGPLVDKSQFDRVTSCIESGKQEAKLFYGGTRLGAEGCFLSPTIFIDAPETSKINKDEVFGPVVVVHEFDDEADVIAKANDTEFGLSGAVYSQDINRALRVASKIHSGTVCVNCSVQSDVETPFGGVKQSGWGRENGKHGVLSYTERLRQYLSI